MVNVNARIDYYNRVGEGILRGVAPLDSVPTVGSKVRLNDGGLFYTVQSVLISRYGTTVNLGEHNLACRTVETLLDQGFTRYAA